MKKLSALILLFSLFLIQGCFVAKTKALTLKQKVKFNVNVTSLDVSNNLMTINGSGFSTITKLKITGTNIDTNLEVDSKTDTRIIAKSPASLALLIGGSFDLLISNASGAATFPITFTIDQMGASSGQVLKWNGAAWAPANQASSQVYLGGWNANTNTPALSDATAGASGEYYIVTTAGTQDLGSGSVAYLIGDWIMSNGSTWDKILGALSGAGTTNYIPYYTSSTAFAISPLYVSGTSIGIGKTTPGSTLDVKGTLRLSGATSGYVGFAPAAIAGTTTYLLPITEGTAGQVLTTDGVATTPTLSWTTIAGGGSGTVTDVTSANADIGITAGTTIPVLTLNSGTGANQIVKLTAASKLPAVDGSLVTLLNPANLSAAVAVDKGGTGLTAGTANGLPYFSTTTTIASTAAGAADTVLRIPGAGGAPAFGAIDLTKAAAVTGALPLANGGTSATNLAGAQAALGIVLGGATTGTGAIVGLGGVQADKFCVGDNTGGGISCASVASSLLAGSISDESGTGALLFGTAPTMSNPVMTGTLRLSGSTSGYVSFVPAAVAGATTYLLPASQGSAGQVLSTDGVATTPTLSWITPATASSTLAGDVGGALGATTIGTGKVTSTHILDATILNADINTSAAIDATKINTGVVSNAEFNYLDGVTSSLQTQLNAKASSTLASARIFVGNGSNVATPVALSGDATLSNTGALTLATVSVSKGGTGNTSFPTNALLMGNISGAIATVSAAPAEPSVLISTANTALPVWTTATPGYYLKGTVTGVEFGAFDASDLPSTVINSYSPTNGRVPYFTSSNSIENSPIIINGSRIEFDNTPMYIDGNSIYNAYFYSFANGNGLADDGANGIFTAGNFAVGGNIVIQGGLTVSNSLTFPSSGSITGVGNIVPSWDNSYDLGESSTKWRYVYSNNVLQTSDAREKKNIKNSDLGLDFINSLRPVSYYWRHGEDFTKRYGLIAQEIDHTLAGREFGGLHYDQAKDRFSVSYTEFISPIIKALQELFQKITGVDRQVAALKAENALLKKQNDLIIKGLCKKDSAYSFCSGQ